METDWPMGENESRARARELALESLRTRASSAVGVIVESSTSLRSDKLNEEIRTVSISMIQVEDVSDSVKVDATGKAILHVSARLVVDETELQRRAEAMRTDVVKLREIRRLTDENEILRDGIASLRKSMASAARPYGPNDLLAQEQDLLDKLRGNYTDVGSTFMPGTLVELAKSDRDGWAAERLSIDALIVDEMLNSPVQVRLMGVEQTEGSYVAKVNVAWKPNFAALNKSLSRYFWSVNTILNGTGNLIAIDIGRFNNTAKRSEFSERAMQYLAPQSLWLEVKIAGSTASVPMMFTGGTVFGNGVNGCKAKDGWKGIASKQGSLCFVEQFSTSQSMMGDIDLKNPVTLKLTKAQAERATELRAYLVLQRPDAPERRKEVPLGL
jgi:hypothetical protein